MSRALDRRLQELEVAHAHRRDDGVSMARVLGVERVLAGTATREDYEEVCAGLVDHFHNNVSEFAMAFLCERALGLQSVPYSRPPEHKAEVLANIERLKTDWDWDPVQQAWARLLGWQERLNLLDGDEFNLMAEQCSYFETQTPPPGLRERVEANTRSDDLDARVRAHFYLVLIDDKTELGIRRYIERSAPGILFDMEGAEGRNERSIAYYRYHCHGDVYDVTHDRLPASCYTPEGPKNCGCTPKPRERDPDWVPKLNARIKRDRDEWARRIGARLDIPPGITPDGK